MIAAKIKGKVLDEKGQPIPSALVFLSTKDGTLVKEFRTRADVDGNYELPFLMKIPTVIGTPITVPLSEYITAKMLSFPTITIPIKQGSDLNSFDIVMKIRNQVLDEVTVTASKDPYECRKKGGKYDFKTKTCIMPKAAKQKTWYQKNMWWLIGAGTLLTATSIFIVVRNRRKK